MLLGSMEYFMVLKRGIECIKKSKQSHLRIIFVYNDIILKSKDLNPLLVVNPCFGKYGVL